MFDIKKLNLRPSMPSGFMQGASDEQILELERYLGCELPGSYKEILKKYNGSMTEAETFIAENQDAYIELEWEFSHFYWLGENRNNPGNIWWVIEHYGQYFGENAIPIADDGVQQYYFLKKINGELQVWHLSYLDMETPEAQFVISSFDKLLCALYAEE